MKKIMSDSEQFLANGGKIQKIEAKKSYKKSIQKSRLTSSRNRASLGSCPSTNVVSGIYSIKV